MTEEIIIDCAFYKDGVCASPINKTCEYCKNIEVSKCYHKQLKRLEQENKELKEEIQFHNKENSNLLAERNAAQIGYDEIREVREQYRSALEEIREFAEKSIKISYNLEVNSMLYDIKDKINEVLK